MSSSNPTHAFIQTSQVLRHRRFESPEFLSLLISLPCSWTFVEMPIGSTLGRKITAPHSLAFQRERQPNLPTSFLGEKQIRFFQINRS